MFCYLYLSQPIFLINRDSLLGKVLRLDVDHRDEGLAYSIPSSNPYFCVDDCPTWRQEIYAYGIRNIWRCDLDEGDPTTGLHLKSYRHIGFQLKYHISQFTKWQI